MSADLAVTAGIRDFGAAEREARGIPVRFILRGETFTCLDPVPLGGAVAVAASSDSDDFAQMSILGRALRALLIPADRDRWDSTLIGVSDTSVLMSILGHVIVESTGRPTEEPDDSPGSSSPTTPASMPPPAAASANGLCEPG